MLDPNKVLASAANEWSAALEAAAAICDRMHETEMDRHTPGEQNG